MKNNQESIKATPNYKNRTFTLRKYFEGKLYAKYRTVRLSEDEFEDLLYNTEGDWFAWLQREDAYYIVK